MRQHHTRKRRIMRIITTTDEIPEFASECEEHNYWSTHAFGSEMFAASDGRDDDLPPPYDLENTSLLRVRLENTDIDQLRAAARARRISIRTLMLHLVADFLADERDRAAHHVATDGDTPRIAVDAATNRTGATVLG